MQTSETTASPNRPTGVTVAGWILLVAGGVELVSVPLRLANPAFRQFLEALGQSWILALSFSSVAAGVELVAGGAILRGHNWGRLLYLWFAAAALLVQWIFYGGQTDVCSYVPSVAVYLVLFTLLTRPEAQAWFGAHGHVHEQPDGARQAALGAAGATAAVAATLLWGLGLGAYEAGNFSGGFVAAFRDHFPKYVLPALILAPLFGIALGLWFARHPQSVLSTAVLGAAAAVLNHTLAFVAVLVAPALRGDAGLSVLLPFIGVFLGATAAPLWIGAAFLLRALSRRTKGLRPG